MYEVRIIDRLSEEVIIRIPCNDQRDSKRVDSGLNIDLDHDRFYTVIDEVSRVTPREV